MKFIPLNVYVLWSINLAFICWACWAVSRKGFFAHWKAFGYYLFYQLAQNLLLLTISLTVKSSRIYAVGYVVADFIEVILLSLVVLEILVKVLDPFEALPGRTVARLCYWAVLGVSVAVALSVALPGNHRADLVVDLPLTVERTIYLAEAMIMWVLLFQSKALGVTWKSSVAEIAIGFVLYLTVQATTRFVMGLYDNDVMRELATEVGQVAYLISLGGWIWTMTHRDPLPARPPAETLARVHELAAGYDAVPKERIFAAVGIKINRPETEEHGEETQSAAGNHPGNILVQ